MLCGCLSNSVAQIIIITTDFGSERLTIRSELYIMPVFSKLVSGFCFWQGFNLEEIVS